MKLHRTTSLGRRVVATALLAMAGCGDPLLNGGDPGPPSIILDVRVLGLDPIQANRSTSPVLIWTPLGEPVDPFELQVVDVVTDGVDTFRLRVFGGPSDTVVDEVPSAERDDPPKVAIGFVGIVEESPIAGAITGTRLRSKLRGVSDTHYVLWVHRPELARTALADTVLNPDALNEGMNLVVGLCRPGRDSELLVVPPERVNIGALADAVPGTCLDVFWGDWR